MTATTLPTLTVHCTPFAFANGAKPNASRFLTHDASTERPLPAELRASGEPASCAILCDAEAYSRSRLQLRAHALAEPRLLTASLHSIHGQGTDNAAEGTGLLHCSAAQRPRPVVEA